MTIKYERRGYVQCDQCGLIHIAREANSYMARVKAGVDGWESQRELGKGGTTYDYCPDCKGGASVTFSRDLPQGSDERGAGQETS